MCQYSSIAECDDETFIVLTQAPGVCQFLVPLKPLLASAVLVPFCGLVSEILEHI